MLGAAVLSVLQEARKRLPVGPVPSLVLDSPIFTMFRRHNLVSRSCIAQPWKEAYRDTLSIFAAVLALRHRVTRVPHVTAQRATFSTRITKRLQTFRSAPPAAHVRRLTVAA